MNIALSDRLLPHRSARLLRLFLPAFMLAGLFWATPAHAAEAGDTLVKQLRVEQDKAKERRASLVRLTEQERNVNAGLAAAEDRILKLESALAKQEERLGQLATSDAELQERFETLDSQRLRTEETMGEVLRTLWELLARRLGVEGRDLPDWPVTDREHSWSVELLASLDKHRAELLAQENALDEIRRRREAVAKEVETQLAALNREKEQLLHSRVNYAQRLNVLRKEKQDTEAELTDILKLVETLNLRVRESAERGDLDKARGKLPWPVQGNLRERFNEGASPPSRGLILATAQGAEVNCVHWGKVVHNDVLRGFGRVVIVMHGGGYYSLYAFLSESSLRVGQDLARGESVGKAGFVPALNGPGLYFELRFHQKAINPELWLSK